MMFGGGSASIGPVGGSDTISDEEVADILAAAKEEPGNPDCLWNNLGNERATTPAHEDPWGASTGGLTDWVGSFFDGAGGGGSGSMPAVDSTDLFSGMFDDRYSVCAF